MNNEDEYFEKLSNALGTTYEKELPKAISDEIKDIENKTTEIQKSIENTLPALRDQSYIDFELKNLISSSNTVLMNLESELKIGSPPRMYEVYSTLINTKRELLKELIQFNKLIMDMSMYMPTDKAEENKDTGDLNVSSSEMLKFFKSLKDETKSVEAEFTIEDAGGDD